MHLGPAYPTLLRISFGTRKMEWDVRTKHCGKTWDKAGRLVVLSYYLITSHLTFLTSILEPVKLWKPIPGCSMTWEPGMLMHVLFCLVYTLLVQHVPKPVYFLSNSEFHLDRIKVVTHNSSLNLYKGKSKTWKMSKTNSSFNSACQVSCFPGLRRDKRSRIQPDLLENDSIIVWIMHFLLPHPYFCAN